MIEVKRVITEDTLGEITIDEILKSPQSDQNIDIAVKGFEDRERPPLGPVSTLTIVTNSKAVEPLEDLLISREREQHSSHLVSKERVLVDQKEVAKLKKPKLKKQCTADRMAAATLKKYKEVAGFMNLGDTCFIAATLQLLYHSSLRESIMQAANLSNGENLLLMALADVFKGKDDLEFTSILRVKESVSQMCGKFLEWQQEDSHEFLGDCLNLIGIEDTCFTIHEMRVCLECGLESSGYEWNQDLCLALRHNLLDMVDQYFKPEVIELNCMGCDSKTAKLSRHIIQPPKQLLIHFMRFDSNLRRRCDPVIIPPYLSLKNHSDGDSNRYILSGIVFHLGSSLNRGHYTYGHRGERGWTYFDDDTVKLGVADLEHLFSSNAYLVTYQQI